MIKEFQVFDALLTGPVQTASQVHWEGGQLWQAEQACWPAAVAAVAAALPEMTFHGPLGPMVGQLQGEAPPQALKVHLAK